MKPFVRSAYNYDMNEASDESGLKCEDPTLAQQQYREESDINTIVERFNLTGTMPTNLKPPTYADYTDEITDYQTAWNMVVRARETFMQLPAKVRTRFDNDPQKFLTFCEDPENADEAKKLGLVNVPPKPVESPQGDGKPIDKGATPPPPPAPGTPPKT